MNTYKIPLTLGITGHRDLREEDYEELRNSVRKVFQFLREHYPNSDLQLISPLAEGADSLVAQVALDEKIQLVAPLPLPQKLYEDDFQSSESQQTFAKLLKQAQVFELPLLNNTENLFGYGKDRDKQYALVGAYVARHSHILIALWDGQSLEKSAGTSQVVKFKLSGNMKDLPDNYKPPHSPIDVPDTGAVCHIMTARKTGTQLDETVGKISVLLPHDDEEKELEALLSYDLAELNRFNHDVEKYATKPKLQRHIENGKKYLFPKSSNFSDLLPANIIGTYSTANILAQYFQKRFFVTTIATLFIAMLMIFSYGYYADINNNPIILSIYLGLFLIALGILWLSEKWYYHNNQLDYRALAEGLRVQIFWHLGGLTKSVADYYLRKQRCELIWIRKGIRALNVYDWIKHRQKIEVVQKHWLINQRDWFKEAAGKNHDKAKTLNHWIMFLYSLGVIFIIGMLITQVIGILEADMFLYKLLILLIALLPAAGVLLYKYAEQMGFDEQAEQYERMHELFKRANEVLNSQGEVAAQEILFELGKEALEENADWVLLHRKKPLHINIFELPWEKSCKKSI